MKKSSGSGRPRWVWACVLFSAAAFGLGVVLSRHGARDADGITSENPVNATCRAILDDPGYYHGRLVRVPTVGMRPGPNPEELVYFRFFGSPPVLVARFVHPVPVPAPDSFVGRVLFDKKSPVVVIDCRPD